MLKVLPIQSKTEQEAICLHCGVKYDADLLAYSATIDDRLVGVCQFKVTDRGGIIKDIASVLEGENETDEKEALFVLGRATLNTGYFCLLFSWEILGNVLKYFP